jgi:hypothetical protein
MSSAAMPRVNWWPASAGPDVLFMSAPVRCLS